MGNIDVSVQLLREGQKKLGEGLAGNAANPPSEYLGASVSDMINQLKGLPDRKGRAA